MEFIDKILSVELKPTLQLGHHPPLSPTGGVRSNDGGGGVCVWIISNRDEDNSDKNKDKNINNKKSNEIIKNKK